MRTTRLAAAIVGLAVVGATAGRAADLPAGFNETLHVLLTAPGSIAFDPSGRLWISQHTGGTVGRIYTFDGLLRLALTLPTDETGERGIHSIEIDPDFASNGHVWVYYTAPGPPSRNRLSRFTFASGALTSEVTIVEGPAVQALIHNGGCLTFAPDETLFLGMGEDSGGTAFAQDPHEVRGKLLLLNRDGSPVADNPWQGGSGDPRVWAIGLRNPYRCRVEPGSGTLLLTDVGSFRWEEINLGLRGANFGWASAEGFHNSGLPGLTYPIYAYPSRLTDGTGAAIIGGDFARAGDFAPEYEGNYFFGDWARDEIHRMVLDESLQPVTVTRFATGARHLTDLRFGPDGALYYTARTGTPGVWRIAYDGSANRPPVAIATGTPDSGLAPLSVVLDAAGSYDPDGGSLSYSWDFGDSSGSTEAAGAHAYAAGVYEARVTVTDAAAASAVSAPVRVVAGNRRPTATIVTPGPGATYIAGETISYFGTGSDPEDGNLACANFTWQILFHHNVHAHPHLGPIQGGCGGSFATAARGETESNVWYEVRLGVKDSGQPLGAAAELTHVQSIDVQPVLATITFETAPHPDFAVELDFAAAPAPLTLAGVAGLIRTIGAPNGQVALGRTWSWIGWSDGGAREHEIAAPAVDTTFTATFGCKVVTEVSNLVVEAQPGGVLRLVWDDVTDACLETGSPSYRIYAAPTARAVLPPGQFPVDPPFALVANSSETTFDYAAGPGDEYFLVVAVGTDRADGPTGAY